MYKFGSRSILCLSSVHLDLQKIAVLAISRTNVDFGIHQGERTIDQQQQYFNNGKSKINPQSYPSPEALAEKAKHITIKDHPKYKLSRAIDIHVSEKYNGKSLAWDEVHLSYIAGVLISCAKELLNKGEITHSLRWGGDWDSDGVIGLDHSLRDLPHFELV